MVVLLVVDVLVVGALVVDVLVVGVLVVDVLLCTTCYGCTRRRF